ncbi:MAG: glycosyltransferase [Zoogloeaceae bacterium]|jgi:glycosyltransferase involved in cell wall biosynthesis|nr:glycosyltransferase [Zoogloeaceae bacterium]
MSTAEDFPWVLQFCHGYDAPFLDCARQYAALFADTPYRVCTVYLTGTPCEAARLGSASDEVIFLGYDSKAVRGLKLAAMRDLKRIAAQRDFRFCLAHRFKPIHVALWATNLPVIGIHHAFGDYRRVARRLLVRLFRRRLALLGVSRAVRDDLRASLPFLAPERVGFLYNRLDVSAARKDLLSRMAARDALGLPSAAWIVGNVGRLHPDKDQDTLLRGFALALPRLPAGSLLVLMGSGRLREKLAALAASLGIAASVRFLGQVENGRRYFRAFDLFALTSDHEPFGMVLLEAMAAEVPVLCTDCGGGREVAGADDLFPLRDSAALAEKLTARAGENAETRLVRTHDNLARLQACFSETAARQAFWQLPMTQDFRVQRIEDRRQKTED